MGYLNSLHIKKFVKGQTIKQLTSDEKDNSCTLEFVSGEKLYIYPFAKEISARLPNGGIAKTVVPEIIVTPMNADGVIQTTEIEKNEKA